MGSEIGCKFPIALITQRLNRAHYRGWIEVVSLGQSPGGEKVSFFGVIQNVAKQFLPAGAEIRLGLRKAGFQRGKPRLSLIVAANHFTSVCSRSHGTDLRHALTPGT